MGFLMRWGLIVIGCFLIYGGISEWMTYKPIHEKASAVTVEEAVKLAASKGQHFISMDAELTESALYSTGLQVPRYTASSADTIHTIDFKEKELNLGPYWGAVVEAKSMMNPLFGGIVIQSVTTRQGENKSTITQETYFAPLLSGKNKIWVLSPAFSPNSKTKEEWKTKKSFMGRLIRLQDLNKNRSSLKKTYKEIIHYLANNQRMRISGSTWVILDGASRESLTRRAKNAVYYVPVLESKAALFCKVNAREEALFLEKGIQGVLESKDSRFYGEFGRIMEMELPERIGVIVAKTAKELNEESASLSFWSIKAGLFMLALGVLWLYLRWHKRLKTFKQHGGDLQF
ncbi:MAG: hypothetical protein ACYTGH_09450 [Planctomycetota bacterium]|jgi:hypothetical protein